MQSLGELKWPLDLEGPLPKVGTDSLEGPLQVFRGYLFLGSKVLGEAEKWAHPREPVSCTPTAQIGGLEMIVLWVTYMARCSFDALFKDKGDYERPKMAKIG